MRWTIAAVVGVAIAAGVAWWLAACASRLPPGAQVELAHRELPGAASLFSTGKLWVERVEFPDGELDAKRPDLRAHSTGTQVRCRRSKISSGCSSNR